MIKDTWTCEFCSETYTSGDEYTMCGCAGMTAFRAGRSVPYSLSEQKEAETEAALRGMSFIVDGKHVSADRVFILSVPDTIGPISNMRAAKADAKRVMEELEAFQLNVSKPMNAAHVAMTGQHLSQIMDVLGLEKKPDWDYTYLGMHSYITMVDIEAKCRSMMSEMLSLIQANNDLREIVHGGEKLAVIEFTPSTDAPAGPLPCMHCGSSDSRMRAACKVAGCPHYVVINGILVTDPELAAPISDEAPGPASCACGVCGKLFDHPSSLFCDEHR